MRRPSRDRRDGPPLWPSLSSSPSLAIWSRTFWLPSSMHRLVLIAVARIDEACTLQQGAQVVQRDASVNLNECSLYDVLELGRVQGARAAQRQQMSPGLGREPSTLVRSQYTESHCHSL